MGCGCISHNPHPASNSPSSLNCDQAGHGLPLNPLPSIPDHPPVLSRMMTSDFFFSLSLISKLPGIKKGDSVKSIITRPPPLCPSTLATDRGHQRGVCSLRNPGRQAAQDSGPRPPCLGCRAHSTPKQGALPLPTHSFLRLPACPLASRAPLASSASQPSESTAKGPPPPFAVVHSKSGFLHNSDWGGGCGRVEDAGEAEALPYQK